MPRVIVAFTCLLAVCPGLPQREDAGCPSTTTPGPFGPPPPGRQCACSPDKLWLDIIVAVDNSASMGRTGLSQIGGALSNAFGTLTIGQGLVQTSRVALISYSANGRILANLTAYSNSLDLMKEFYNVKPSSGKQVNLLDALKKTDVVREAVSQSSTRKTVIVLAASAFNGEGKTDPTPFADQLKESGVKILTLAFVRNNEGEEEVQKISNLASPGFAFRSDRDQSTLAHRIQQAFCQANCFCPNQWLQVADDFQKPTAKYAECVLFSSAPSNWYGASMACGSAMNNAVLASERSKAKHKFHADYVRSVNGNVKPYFIGLSWDDASQQYLWSEKFDNGTQIPLGPNDFEAWASGNGNHGKNPDGVQVNPSGFDTYWYDVAQFGTSSAYMCQVNACDTDNYCDDSIDDDN
ncbi:Protein CLEC-62 a [Aphelenchoides avenae]|nr:Protein CLEC-62 a [Aphelenchus avenae]